MNVIDESTSKPVTKLGMKTFVMDMVYLLKRIVLVANVLPVFTGFWLALYFTNASFMANFDLFLLTIFGSTFTIAGALIINNWYEVDLDENMERTQKRPTVTGNMSMQTVLIMGISSSVIGLTLMAFTTMEATVYAFLGWFTYVVLYTFWTKRKYTLNTVIGSVSGAFTPVIGWAAIEPAFHIVPIVLFLILFIWQVPHTFAIVMRRYDDYKAAGVPMLPVVYGFEMTKRQTLVYIACLLPLPMFLTSLGTTFVIIVTAMNIGWIIVGLRGFLSKDNLKWANQIFFYSLNYLFILFVLMVVVTLPVFQ